MFAAGRHRLPLTTLGILLGGHVRVGFEDDLPLPAGASTPRAAPNKTREILGL